MKKAGKWQYQFAKVAFAVLCAVSALVGLLAIVGGSVAGGVFFFAFAGLFLFASRKYGKTLKNWDNPVPAPVAAAPAVSSSAEKAPASVVPSVESSQVEKVKTYKVAGVTQYVDNIMNLATLNPYYGMSKRELVDEGMTGEKVWRYDFYPEKIQLEPEPDNAFDPNAIKVIVDGEHVGYIKSGSCAHLLKVIKENRIVSIRGTIGGGAYKYVSEEYDDEKDKEIYTLEKDSVNYFVHLEISEG